MKYKIFNEVGTVCNCMRLYYERQILLLIRQMFWFRTLKFLLGKYYNKKNQLFQEEYFVYIDIPV